MLTKAWGLFLKTPMTRVVRWEALESTVHRETQCRLGGCKHFPVSTWPNSKRSCDGNWAQQHDKEQHSFLVLSFFSIAHTHSRNPQHHLCFVLSVYMNREQKSINFITTFQTGKLFFKGWFTVVAVDHWSLMFPMCLCVCARRYADHHWLHQHSPSLLQVSSGEPCICASQFLHISANDLQMNIYVVTTLKVWLGLGAKNTWLGLVKDRVLRFCHHKHGRKLSRGIVQNISFCMDGSKTC